MIKSGFLLLVISIIGFGASAQITITSSTLPVLGDTLRYSWAYNQASDDMITPPGFDLSWNFTGLNSDKKIDEIYQPPSEGQFAAQFPEANLLVVDSNGERYYRVTASGLELLGQSEKKLFGYPFTVVYKYSNPYKERYTPLNFFDIYQSFASSLTGFKFTELPVGLQAAFLAAGLTTTDSIRLRNSFSKIVSVNAVGTLTIPGPDPKPTYAVLRQNQTQYRERRIDAHVIPLGWLDITDITMQYVPGSTDMLGIDTTGAHIFFNDATKEEIGHIELNSQGLPGTIRYKNNFKAACSWAGIVNNAWENAANWNCGHVPVSTDDLVIKSGTIVINSAVTVNSLKLEPGVHVTVASGSLTVLH